MELNTCMNNRTVFLGVMSHQRQCRCGVGDRRGGFLCPHDGPEAGIALRAERFLQAAGVR